MCLFFGVGRPLVGPLLGSIRSTRFGPAVVLHQAHGLWLHIILQLGNRYTAESLEMQLIAPPPKKKQETCSSPGNTLVHLLIDLWPYSGYYWNVCTEIHRILAASTRYTLSFHTGRNEPPPQKTKIPGTTILIIGIICDPRPCWACCASGLRVPSAWWCCRPSTIFRTSWHRSSFPRACSTWPTLLVQVQSSSTQQPGLLIASGKIIPLISFQSREGERERENRIHFWTSHLCMWTGLWPIANRQQSIARTTVCVIALVARKMALNGESLHFMRCSSSCCCCQAWHTHDIDRNSQFTVGLLSHFCFLTKTKSYLQGSICGMGRGAGGLRGGVPLHHLLLFGFQKATKGNDCVLCIRPPRRKWPSDQRLRSMKSWEDESHPHGHTHTQQQQQRAII